MMRLYATFDPAALGPALGLEQANTVLVTTATGDINRTARALYGKQSWQGFAEFAVWGDAGIANAVSFGLVKASASLSTYVGGDADGYGYRPAEGQIHTGGASIATVPVSDKGAIVGIWFRVIDGDARATWFVDGLQIHEQALPDAGPWFLAATISSPTADSLRAWINTGQRAFEFPVAGAEGGWYELPPEVPTLRVATETWIAPADDPYPNAKWEGRIHDEGVEVVSQLAFVVDGGSRSTQGSAVSIPLTNGDGALDWMLDVDVRDLAVAIQTAFPGESLLDAGNVASMLVDDVQALDSGLVRITMSSSMALLDEPLQRMIFPPSADPAAAGKPWPISLGAVRSMTPLPVDPVNRIFAVHDRAVPGWGFIRIAGAPYNPNAIPPDYVIGADFRTFILETDPVGKLTADVSSTGGGSLPTLADDIWLGYGNPFTDSGSGTLAGFDQQSGATHVPLTLARLTSTGALSAPYFALSTAQLIEGRSYRYRVEIVSKPPAHSGGMPSVSLATSTGMPLANFNAAGVFEGVITATATTTPRIQLNNALNGTGATIRVAYILAIPDEYEPSELNAITLTDFVREIVEVRFGKPPSAWSRADTEAIDAATGYLGIGFHASEAISVRNAIEAAMSAYACCAWVDQDDVLRFTRLTPPEDETPVGEITEDDMLSELSVRPDLAPGLSTQMRFRRNWTVLSPTDFVSDTVLVNMATRRALGQQYQGIVASAIQLGPSYRHAVYADPIDTLLDDPVDAQAAIDHLAGYYARPRYFYGPFEVSDVLPVRLGEIWTLRHPRYGLAVGRPLLVSRVSRRAIAGTLSITLRG